MWKIESCNPQCSRPSYLFGTIHSADSRVVRLPAPVQAAFDESEHFCMEVVLDTPAFAALARSMILPPGHTLRGMLGPELFDAVTPLMGERGVPPHSLLRLKPWAVYAILNSPRQKAGQVLDMVLYRRARQQGKSTCGLETVEEQVAIFSTAAVEEQRLLLRDTVIRYTQLSALSARLIARYLARDLAGLVGASEESGPTDAAVKRVFDEFVRRGLDQRNLRLLDRMDAALREGGTFIAVGALHLPGEQGLLRLLHQQGYTLEAMY